MNLRSDSNQIKRLGTSLLKERRQAEFRNERRGFVEFVEDILRKFPEALSDSEGLREPFRSLALLALVGQRPITSLLLLQVLLNCEGKPMSGGDIYEHLSEEMGIKSSTESNSYEDVVGDLTSTLVKIGILEEVSLGKTRQPQEGAFRVKRSAVDEARALLERLNAGKSMFGSSEPYSLNDLLKKRFDKRLSYVVKSGTGRKQPFNIGKIVKSLLDPKLGIPFEEAITIIEEIGPSLKKGMKTFQIQSILYDALKKHDEKAAENYRLSYPKILSVKMSQGEAETLNYKLVKILIDKEAKLKLTRNLQDKLASTVYKVISRNPEKYRNETAIREYIYALIRSDCMYVKSPSDFIKDHLDHAISALDGCTHSLESEEVASARGLFEQFLEHISLVILVELGYLPFKNSPENVDLISNLLRQEGIRTELQHQLQIDLRDLVQLQRIRFLMQGKDTANRKSLGNLAEEAQKLADLCERIRMLNSLHRKPKLVSSETAEATSSLLVTTGYEDLDAMLLGGIPDRHAVLLTCPSCDERDLLIDRFLEAGIEQQQTTFHMTVDARTTVALAKKFPQNFYLFVCNPEADAIVKSLPNVFKLKGVDNLTDIDIALASAFRMLDDASRLPRRASIEIISDVLLQHQAVSTRRWLAALLPKLRSRGFTTLAIMNPHMHSPQEVQAVLDLFQGEIHMYKKKTEKGLRRFLRIEKMVDREYLQTELQLKVERMQKRISR